jgi:hypothetical protein
MVIIIALMMEAASTFASVNFYETTRRIMPEDSLLHVARRF